MKTNWQDPGSTEIRSTQIAGLQGAVGKIEDALDLQTTSVTGASLTEVYISEADRYRIYQVANQVQRNWVASPAPVIKKNGIVVSSGFGIDYAGGAVIFSPNLTVTDVVTADFSYVSGNTTISDASAPTGDTGTVKTILDWLANMIKSITGKVNWRTAPATTLEAANTHYSATTGIHGVGVSTIESTAGSQAKVDTHAGNTTTMHGAVSTATADKLLIRDANGRAKVVAPAAADDIATKGYVDSSAGGKTNLLTNGGFEIWQRGAGPFTTAVYTSDRWKAYLEGTDTLSITREGITKKADSLYSLKAVYTKGTGTAGQISQFLVIADGFHHLLGKTISLRVSVHANAAGAARIGIESNGTGASVTYGSYHAGDSTWVNLEVSRTIPTDATFIYIHMDLRASVTAYFDNAMLVPGSIAADYISLHPAEEMQRCQRYYEVHGGVATGIPSVGRIYASGANNYMNGYTFNTKKGGIPTMTKNGTFTVENCGQPAVYSPSPDGYIFYVAATAAGNIYATPDATCTITAEYNP